EFQDTQPPNLTFLSPIRSHSGKEGDVEVASKSIPCRIDFLAPVEENVQEIR
ncbi:hypothetical protein HDU98_003621, partial [Podochytrium sp. JEL0797]